MLFSAHVADTNPFGALRRRTPKEGDGSGLKSARVGICAPFTKGALPRPQLGREAMVACWQDEDALDRFLVEHPTGNAFAKGWHVRMELVRAVGVFPGLNHDMVAEAGDRAKDMTGPSVALTAGTAYVRSLVPFLKVTSGLEEQFLATPQALWGTGFSNLAQRFFATITVWESLDAANNYMKTGAHGAAVKDHFDHAKDPTGHTFVTGGGFLGFRPLSTHGTLGGKNPVPAGILR